MSEAVREEEKLAPKFQAPKKRRKWLRRLITAAVLAVLALVLLRGCMNSAKQNADGAWLPAQVTRQDMSVTVTGTGTVKPNDSYRATTLLKGEILSAPFEEGDLVRKDQVLFTLDPTDAENNIKNAESGVNRAQLGLEQAQLNVRNLLRTQADMAIKATATGTISKLYIDPGDMVSAVGVPTVIADILDRDTMELTVPFHAVHAQSFYAGQTAQVTVTGSANPLAGSVYEVGAVDQVTAGNAVVRQVKIRVSNPGAIDRGTTATAQVGEYASAGIGAFDYAAAKQVLALTSGVVDSFSVKEGSRVTKGQVIGYYEHSDLQSQIENAKLSVRSAELSLHDAQEGLRIARDLLDNYTISSPIDGTVIEKNYKAGDNIDPSTAAASGQSVYMAVIYDMSRLTFDMNVSELDVSRLKVGQSVTFTSDAIEGATFTGHVDKININGTTISGNTNYPVTVVIDKGEGLYPGMNVSATILVEELGSVLAVPADAVQRPSFVYVAGEGALDKDGNLADPGKLIQKEIEIGRTDSVNIEVLSGLSEGDTVYIPNQATNMMQGMAQVMGGM